jgi:hypothetical protein
MKNTGTWNNPGLFFLVLFLSSWLIILWFDPITIRNKPYPVLSVTTVELLISLLLVATRTIREKKESMKKLTDERIIEVETRSENREDKFVPNLFFWIVLLVESILIITGYLIEYII